MRAGVNNVNISLVMMLPDCNWISIRTVPLPFMATPTPPTVEWSVEGLNVIKSVRWAERFIENAESATQHWDSDVGGRRCKLRRATGQRGELTMYSERGSSSTSTKESTVAIVSSTISLR
jgi:hypothetical protein